MYNSQPSVFYRTFLLLIPLLNRFPGFLTVARDCIAGIQIRLVVNPSRIRPLVIQQVTGSRGYLAADHFNSVAPLVLPKYSLLPDVRKFRTFQDCCTTEVVGITQSVPFAAWNRDDSGNVGKNTTVAYSPIVSKAHKLSWCSDTLGIG